MYRLLTLLILLSSVSMDAQTLGKWRIANEAEGIYLGKALLLQNLIQAQNIPGCNHQNTYYNWLTWDPGDIPGTYRSSVYGMTKNPHGIVEMRSDTMVIVRQVACYDGELYNLHQDSSIMTTVATTSATPLEFFSDALFNCTTEKDSLKALLEKCDCSLTLPSVNLADIFQPMVAYPNPVARGERVTVDSEAGVIKFIGAYTITGLKIDCEAQEGMTGQHLGIDTNMFPPGIYHLFFEQEGDYINVVKLVVQ